MIKITLLASISMLISFLMTPLIIKAASKLNLTDQPNHRKMHDIPVPTLGGTAIFVSFIIGMLILHPVTDGRQHLAIITGACLIVILGVLDDILNLSAKVKFLFQFLIAAIVVFFGGVQLEFINLPFGGELEFGFLSSMITLLWIVGVTNAINLIDGLDGLAAGVSAIALGTISVMAVIMGQVYVASMALVLFFSIIGFLRYNFHPAKIFMGDTGALFLGYMISVLALMGFKNVALVSFIIPIFILGVPISDTLIAIIRRYTNNLPISSPDSSHLHHRLMKFGFTHKQTVLFMYALSFMFSMAAILFSMTTLWGSVVIFIIAVLTVQFLIENLEMINSEYKPLTKILNGIIARPHK